MLGYIKEVETFTFGENESQVCIVLHVAQSSNGETKLTSFDAGNGMILGAAETASAPLPVRLPVYPTDDTLDYWGALVDYYNNECVSAEGVVDIEKCRTDLPQVRYVTVTVPCAPHVLRLSDSEQNRAKGIVGNFVTTPSGEIKVVTSINVTVFADSVNGVDTPIQDVNAIAAKRIAQNVEYGTWLPYAVYEESYTEKVVSGDGGDNPQTPKHNPFKRG